MVGVPPAGDCDVKVMLLNGFNTSGDIFLILDEDHNVLVVAMKLVLNKEPLNLRECHTAGLIETPFYRFTAASYCASEASDLVTIVPLIEDLNY